MAQSWKCWGQPSTVTNKIAKVVELTLNTLPKDATHWSVRSMAERTEVSPTTVHRNCSESGLEPHRSETHKLCTDSLFDDKVQDVVGQYRSPPVLPISPGVAKGKIMTMSAKAIPRLSSHSTSQPVR